MDSMDFIFPVQERIRQLEGDNEALTERLELMSDKLTVNSNNLKNLHINLNWVNAENKTLKNENEAHRTEVGCLKSELNDLLVAAKKYEDQIREYEYNDIKNKTLVEKQNYELNKKEDELKVNKEELKDTETILQKATMELAAVKSQQEVYMNYAKKIQHECDQKSIEITNLKSIEIYLRKVIKEEKNEIEKCNTTLSDVMKEREKLSFTNALLETEVDRLRVLLREATKPKEKPSIFCCKKKSTI